jgi:hypothetical protein
LTFLGPVPVFVQPVQAVSYLSSVQQTAGLVGQSLLVKSQSL